MSQTAERLYFVQFGAEHVSKSLSVRGAEDTLSWEPFIGLVVQTPAGWVLLDSGMSRRAFESAEIASAYGAGNPAHASAPWPLDPAPPELAEWAWILDGDPLETALATVGLSVSDLALAAISHLHVDHSGGIPTLAAHGVPIAIQRRELEFVRSGAVGAEQGFFAPDWEDERTQWIEIDGDAELAPGVRAISTPGHTPGHMSFAVTLENSGVWIFAGDTADLAQNLLDGVPCGSTASGTPGDEDAAAASLLRLYAEARATDARLVPGHDQIVLNAVRHPTGGHR